MIIFFDFVTKTIYKDLFSNRLYCTNRLCCTKI